MFDTEEARFRDRLRELETQKAAVAAEQARVAAQWDSVRRAREAAEGVPASKRGQGLGSEIALVGLAILEKSLMNLR